MRKEFFVEQYCRFEGPITQLLNLLPDDKLAWSPAENTMPARALASHLALIVKDHAGSMATGQWIPKPADLNAGGGKTKQQLLGEIRGAFAEARRTLEGLSQKDFESRPDKLDAGPIQIAGSPEEFAVSLVLVHIANHVMQLFWYLKQAGVDADSGTLYFGMPPGQFSTRDNAHLQATSA